MDYYLMYIADHDPPHFYVWYDDYKATMTIADGIITGSLPRRAIKWCMKVGFAEVSN